MSPLYEMKRDKQSEATNSLESRCTISNQPFDVTNSSNFFSSYKPYLTYFKYLFSLFSIYLGYGILATNTTPIRPQNGLNCVKGLSRYQQIKIFPI